MKATVRKGFHHLESEDMSLTSNYSKGVRRLFFTIEIEGGATETGNFDTSEIVKVMQKEINKQIKTKPNDKNEMVY